MIKCNVTTCGVITSSAEEKTSKEGEKFISFSMVVPFEGKDGTVKEQYISVSAPGDAQSAANYSAACKSRISAFCGPITIFFLNISQFTARQYIDGEFGTELPAVKKISGIQHTFQAPPGVCGHLIKLFTGRTRRRGDYFLMPGIGRFECRQS